MASAQNPAEESRLGFSLSADQISFDVDEAVYPLEAIYGASYLFVDKCFVYLSRPKAGEVRVQLSSRDTATVAELDTLAGEFANELLSQVTRLKLAQATARIREYYTAAALRAATSAPSIDDLLAELESEEIGEDPLQIMVPWEEKYGANPDNPEPKKDPEAQ
jgi:His-Xaa-Ser system protein HxsD